MAVKSWEQDIPALFLRSVTVHYTRRVPEYAKFDFPLKNEYLKNLYYKKVKFAISGPANNQNKKKQSFWAEKQNWMSQKAELKPKIKQNFAGLNHQITLNQKSWAI